mmetsp:Transcript_19583/g.27579  ORF Transcript_19583/g.27579 Transcript_19583/m.27579 type:complete len:283 (+) Transcript_19583:207-1055(+)
MDITPKKKKKKKKKKSYVRRDDTSSNPALLTRYSEAKNYTSFNPRASTDAHIDQLQSAAEVDNSGERDRGGAKGQHGDDNLDEELDMLVASAISERRRRRNGSTPNSNNEENVKKQSVEDLDDNGDAGDMEKVVVPLPVVPPLIAPPEEDQCHDKEDSDDAKSSSQSKTKKERRKQKRKKKKKTTATSDITHRSENKQQLIKRPTAAETKDRDKVLPPPNQENQLQQGSGLEKRDGETNVESQRTGKDNSSHEEPIAAVTSENLAGEDSNSSVTKLGKKNKS